MPGIIVSRPIFNTLFKLAHEEGLSINAFLTKLLENSGPDAVKHAASGAEATQPAAAPPAPVPFADQGGFNTTALPDSPAPNVRPIEYDDEPQVTRVSATAAGSVDSDRIGNSVWDKVVSMEGKRFATSRGKKFSYRVNGEYIVVRDSQARIPKSQFDKAQKMWPVTGPSRLVGVYAPSVVWAVMKELNEAEEPSMA